MRFIFQSLEKTVQNAVFTCQAPSNIALVKYWGKRAVQIPKNASISFTLQNCYSNTTIEFKKKKIHTQNQIAFDFYFKGSKKDEFKPKIQTFFERITSYCPYIFDYSMRISSKNSFPHSSGIASSASSMAAIALCIISLEKELNPNLSKNYLVQKASFLARLGSGSASRSVEGPIVVWGWHPSIEGSSNLYAIEFPYKIHPVFKSYQDCILLVDKGEKSVSSTLGHHLMNKHPFAEQRFVHAHQQVNRLVSILQNGELKDFVYLVESEALELHAMMLTAKPYFILIKPNTLKIINKIWEFRANTKSNLCFTLDAGANVHVLYPKSEKQQVETFIQAELLRFCQKNQYICDNIGLGTQYFN